MRMGRSARIAAGAVIALVRAFGVSMGTAIVVAVGDSERHVGVFEQVELSVMAGAFEVGAVAERVVVASDLGEVLAGEGVGEVVEELDSSSTVSPEIRRLGSNKIKTLACILVLTSCAPRGAVFASGCKCRPRSGDPPHLVSSLRPVWATMPVKRRQRGDRP